MRVFRHCLCLFLTGAVLVTAAAAQEIAREDIEFFESQVRPVLVSRCFKCHSQSADPVEGELLLDSAAGWARGGESGPVIVAGDPGASRLVQAVLYEDSSLQMPPDGKLSDREVAALVEWVRRGAPDPRTGVEEKAADKTIDLQKGRQYWAFQPLVRSAAPQVKDSSWCRTPIDQFIVSRLEQAGIFPNPSLDRRRLLRRLYFDLMGLPPTPDEVDRFLADQAPDAWERTVDRLLSSPHYGERWGRHWLDIARFAESHGFEQDYDRPTAYHYRDFVIRALNADLPYDTFLKWQIAGDEFEPENPEAMMATGFLAAGVHATQITANQAEKERYDELDDMVRTIGTTMLGLTIGCARCHDHKFDPIPNQDYYRLLATFSTTVRSDMDVNLDPTGYRRAQAAFDAQHAPLVAARDTFEREQLPARLADWARTPEAAPDRFTWVVLEGIEAKSAGNATFTPQADGSLLVGGPNPEHDTITLVAHTSQAAITSVRLEALAHESLVKSGPGRAENGNFGLSEIHLTAAPLDGGTPPIEVKLTNARSTFDQEGYAVTGAIDGDSQTCWAVDPQFGRDHAAVFETEAPLGFPGGTVLSFTLVFEVNKQHAIGRSRLSVSSGPRPSPIDGPQVPEGVLPLLAMLGEGGIDLLSEENRVRLLAWYRTLDPQWIELNRAVDEHARQTPVPLTAKVLVSSEGVPAVRLNTQGADFYDPVYFLKRGDLKQKLEPATSGFLQVLLRDDAISGEQPTGLAAELPTKWQARPPEGWHTSYRRRALANWIADAREGAGHLAARVIVNRLWQHHLGRGLVATPSDFGMQGERPTHPELLDWLAVELVDHGWSLKHIHRMIVTSAVYMQSGDVDQARLAADRDNRLWWRVGPRRLEAEIIRDSILAAGGTLDRRPFGPGSLDLNHARRSIYFFVKRSQLVPMMVLFDAPDSLQDIAQRPATTIAPQALLLMNNEVLRRSARAFAARVERGGAATWEQAVGRAYTIALARPCDPDELLEAVAFLTAQRQSYEAADRADARELALADFCQVLFGLNEFVYVD